MIHRLPINLHMFRVISDESDYWRIQNNYYAHAQKIGLSQRSRFLVLTKMGVTSGDENVLQSHGFFVDNTFDITDYNHTIFLQHDWRGAF